MAVFTTIEQAVMDAAMRRAEQLESDCAAAIAEQDYDKLERLVVVERPGCPPAVASRVDEEG